MGATFHAQALKGSLTLRVKPTVNPCVPKARLKKPAVKKVVK
jgi:hypothetical protein